MTKIGILSDTHGYLDDRVFHHFEACDEVWHAGDIGTMQIVQQLEEFKPCRLVFGNIDNYQIRAATTENQVFEIEKCKIVMTHIAGKPGWYYPHVRELIDHEKPQIFVCGHSHILKVQRFANQGILHINPGAAGNHGFHKVRTMLRFDIDGGVPKNMEVIELGKRG